jgi:hypothetical protein
LSSFSPSGQAPSNLFSQNRRKSSFNANREEKKLEKNKSDSDDFLESSSESSKDSKHNNFDDDDNKSGQLSGRSGFSKGQSFGDPGSKGSNGSE